MIYKISLESIEDEKTSILIRDGRFYFQDSHDEVDLSGYQSVQKRIFYYIKWCEKNSREIAFDIFLFEKLNENFYLKVIRSHLKKIDHDYLLSLERPTSLEESLFGKSLQLLGNVKDAVVVSEAQPIDGIGPRIIYVNKAFEHDTGFKLEEVQGKTPRLLQGNDTSFETLSLIKDDLKNWRNSCHEIKNYKKDGEPFFVELNISPVSDEAGWWTHWVSFQRNKTQLKLNNTSQLKVQEIAKVGHWSLNLISKQVYWSDEVYNIYHVDSKDPITYEKALSFYSSDESDRLRNFIKNCIEKRSQFDEVFEFHDARGELKWARIYGEVLVEQNNEVFEIFGVCQDISELYREKNLLQNLIDYTPDIIYRVNSDGNFTYVSSAWQKALGHLPREVVGQHFSSYVHPDDLDKCQDALVKLMTGEIPNIVIEYRVISITGETRWHRTSGIVVNTGELSFQGIASDITEEKELKLELEAILNYTGIGIWRWQRNSHQITFDESNYKLFGHDEGSSIVDDYDLWINSLHPEDKAEVVNLLDQAIKGQGDFETTFRIYTKNKELKYIKSSAYITKNSQGKVVDIKGINLDKTHEVLLEISREEEKEQNIIKSRLASIGELAAGGGHEINNPLAIAMGNLSMIQSDNFIDPIKVRSIEEAHLRIKKITDGLRNFSRADSEKSDFNLTEVIDESLAFVEKIYQSEGITIKVEDQTNENIFIYGVRAEIQQVLMNLISNAKDATENNKDSREVHISILRIGEQVEVRVKDNGTGIDESIKDKIFDSFFTSKKVGKGTGIGLSLVKKIMIDHDAKIDFETIPNRGTTFILSFKVSKEPKSQDKMSLIVSKSVQGSSVKPLKVLVAEDEEVLREFFQMMLENLGHQVVLCADGKEALDQLKKSTFDLVISDIKMPKLDGIELFRHLKNGILNSEPAFIFVTGGAFIENDKEKEALIQSAQGLLIKPFSEEDLSLKIEEIFSKVESFRA